MLPRGFDALLAKALEKDRVQRYQSATALRNDLERIVRDANPARKRARQATAAVTLLALFAVGIWRYDVYRHRITLSPTDTIVLADADNQTGDPAFDDALNIALRYEMTSSETSSGFVGGMSKCCWPWRAAVPRHWVAMSMSAPAAPIVSNR